MIGSIVALQTGYRGPSLRSELVTFLMRFQIFQCVFLKDASYKQRYERSRRESAGSKGEGAVAYTGAAADGDGGAVSG
jgi:hypothetical protein